MHTASGSTPAPTPRGFARHLPTIARGLLGLVFFVFGLAGLLNLLPPPPKEQMPPGLWAFSEAMQNTGFLLPLVKGTEVVVGALLLLNRFVPLALVLIAPVIVNIVAVHAFLAPSGLGMAIVILGLELYLAWSYRSAFRSMLAAKVRPG
jgi:uncharacterized membrane protein YphA (DoxX/SURF4 family)